MTSAYSTLRERYDLALHEAQQGSKMALLELAELGRELFEAAKAYGVQHASNVNTKRYVCGFAIQPAISPVLGDVLLLRKRADARWNPGLYNGLGGKVERDDATLEHAMYREFREESGGIPVYAQKWHHFHTDVWQHAVDIPHDDGTALNTGLQIKTVRGIERIEVYYMWTYLPRDVMTMCESITHMQAHGEPCSVFTYSEGKVLGAGTAPDVPYLLGMAFLDYARHTAGMQRPVPYRGGV
jgi:8-oxo-dGTP pyrophosphatase MutT (NUDIX family)